MELSRLLLDKWRWLAGLFSRRYVGPQKLDALMKDWAGVEEEEEALAAAEAQALAAAGKGGDAEASEPRVLQVRDAACSSVAGHSAQMGWWGFIQSLPCLACFELWGGVNTSKQASEASLCQWFRTPTAHQQTLTCRGFAISCNPLVESVLCLLPVGAG